MKHKLASRKTVIERFGINLTMHNHKGNTISLISNEIVNSMKQEYLINPDMDWVEKARKVWNTFTKQNDFLTKCSVKGCSTPLENVEMHHVKELGRTIDSRGYKIIKGVGKKVIGYDAIAAGQKRKQVPLCRRHHRELHGKTGSSKDTQVS